MMMQRKKTTIEQGAVADVMSHLSKLEGREKDPAKPVVLSELFRTKEYAAEIQSALGKGYSFDDIAEIFTQRSGVQITGRQLQYHHTREKNLRTKGKKSKSAGAAKKAISPAASQPEASESDEDGASNVADVLPRSPSQPETTVYDRGAFSAVNRWKSS